MRLSSSDITIIKNNILKYSQDATIILFRSRVHDDKRGGDIDIFVETKRTVTLKEKLEILVNIELSGILRKVDLIFKMPHSKEQSIFKVAKEEGIVL